MEKIFEWLQVEDAATKVWVSFGVSWVLLVSFAVIAHKLVVKYYLRLAHLTENNWDNELADRTNKPLQFLFVTLATTISVKLSALPMKDYESIEVILKGLTIFFLFWTLERIVYTLISAEILLKTVSTSSRVLVSVVLRATIFTIAILMILDSAGISITPILASLGVGSIAVALALQDTLSNLFSGFYLLVDKPFQAGDFVELEGGVQGYITKVGWRSTHIRQMTNNIIVVPNTKVASATIINYDLNETQSGLRISCGVAYESDLEKVEMICKDVARNLSSTASYGVKDFEPLVRFTEFGSSSINFNVIVRVDKYDNHFELKHEFIKALHKRFGEEGIEIPFPQSVVSFKTPLKTLSEI